MVQARYCINRVTEENGRREERDETPPGATVELVSRSWCAWGREIKKRMFVPFAHVATIENVNMIVTRQNRKINSALSPSVFTRHSSFYLWASKKWKYLWWNIWMKTFLSIFSRAIYPQKREGDGKRRNTNSSNKLMNWRKYARFL